MIAPVCLRRKIPEMEKAGQPLKLYIFIRPQPIAGRGNPNGDWEKVNVWEACLDMFLS